MYTALGKLRDVLATIPGVNDYLQAASGFDMRILDRLYIQSMFDMDGMEGVNIALALALEGELVITVPGLNMLSVVVGSNIPGYTFLDTVWVIGETSSFLVQDFQVTLRIQHPLIRPIQLHLGDPTNWVAVQVEGSANINSDLDIDVEIGPFSVTPFEIGSSGLVVSLRECQLALSSDTVPAEVIALGYDETFKGIFAKEATLGCLPQCFFAGQNGLEVVFQNLALGQTGASFQVQFTPTPELTGCLLDPAWTLALKSVAAEVSKNIPVNFLVSGALAVPILQTSLAVEFGLRALPEGSYTTSMALSSQAPCHLLLGSGSLDIQQFALGGKLGTDEFKLDGVLSGLALDLQPILLQVEQAEINIAHTPDADAFSIQLKNIPFGVLGTVENAIFQIEEHVAAEQRTRSFHMECVLQWQDIKDRIALPANFPLPPDDGEVKGFLTWEDVVDEATGRSARQVVFRLSLEFTDPDQLWAFIPFPQKPQVRHFQLQLEIRYDDAHPMPASAGGPIQGDLSVSVEMRLPDLPTSPLLESILIHTGDAEGWVKLSISASVDPDGQAHFHAKIQNALAITLQLPGLPQPKPPIYLAVTGSQLDLVGESLKAQLDGDFKLLPIQPGDSLPIGYPIQQLFAGLQPINDDGFAAAGTFGLEFSYQNEIFQLQLNAVLADAQIDIDLIQVLKTLTMGMPAPGGEMPEGVPLDIGFRLKGLSLSLGDTLERDSFKVMMGVNIGAFSAIGSLSFSGERFEIGIDQMVVPVNVPRFPLSQAEFDAYYDDPHWEANLNGRIADCQARIQAADGDADRQQAERDQVRLLEQKALLRGIFAIRSRGAGPHFKDLLGPILHTLETVSSFSEPLVATPLYELTNQVIDVLQYDGLPIQKIALLKGSGFHDRDRVMSQDELVRSLTASLGAEVVERWKTRILQCALVSGATITAEIDNQRLTIAQNLCLVLTKFSLKIPYRSPRDINVGGSIRFSGFQNEFAFLNIPELSLGISTDLLYFSVQGANAVVRLPIYHGDGSGYIAFSEFKIGFGYTKRSFALNLAGGVKLPEKLVDDLDTSDVSVAGIRLPIQSKLYFRLDLVPIPAPDVVIVLPVFQFNFDLRQDISPAITDRRICAPDWDGLQVVIPQVFHIAIRHLAFSPMFGFFIAENFDLDGAVTFGDNKNGASLIVNDMKIISPLYAVGFSIPLPGLADGIPFCDDLCFNLRMAGFQINFDVQRPFPSLSPFAVFELLALLSDPAHYQVNPRGELANSLRITLKDASIELPPDLRPLFPNSPAMISKPLNITINLATYISAVQAIWSGLEPAVRVIVEMLRNPAEAQQQFAALVQHPPHFNPDAIFALLPPELRKVSLSANLAGFSARAVVILINRDRLAEELDGHPARQKVLLDGSIQLTDFQKPGTAARYQQNLRPHLPARNGSRAFAPDDPGEGLFRGKDFAGLDVAAAFKALPAYPLARPGQSAPNSVVIAAQVKVIDGQRRRFCGLVYEDGWFGLVSESDAAPLTLQVAGIDVKFPFKAAPGTRFILTGRAKRDGFYGYISIEGTGSLSWLVLPLKNVRLDVTEAGLKIYSTGAFAISGKVNARIGGARLSGDIDIQETHAFLKNVSFSYPASPAAIPVPPLIEANITANGRIGPGRQFSLDGTGSASILGHELAEVMGKLNASDSNLAFALAGWLSASDLNLGGIQVDVDLRVAGSVQIDGPEASFDLEGDGRLSVLEATITGRARLAYLGGKMHASVEGRLTWRDNEWINGRLAFDEGQGITIGGRTLITRILTPQMDPTLRVAGLVIKLDLGGTLHFNPACRLDHFDLHGDLILGIQAPENNQVIPLVMKTFDHSGSPDAEGILIRPLVSMRGVHWLPGPTISLPGLDLTVTTNTSVTALRYDTAPLFGATVLIPGDKYSIDVPTTFTPTITWKSPDGSVLMNGSNLASIPTLILPALENFDIDLKWVEAEHRFDLHISPG